MTILNTLADARFASGLSEAARTAIKNCTVSRGAGAGQLKRNCPPGYGADAGAWQALMLSANAYKASVYRIAMLTKDGGEVYAEIMDYLSARPQQARQLAMVDKDRRQLEALGVW